jgi:hypothetical protein
LSKSLDDADGIACVFRRRLVKNLLAETRSTNLVGHSGFLTKGKYGSHQMVGPDFIRRASYGT